MNLPRVLLIFACVTAFLIALRIFLVAPRRCDRAKYRVFLNRVYAHRGMFDNDKVPENSMPAFRAAVKKGHGIEFDIHLTKDGEIVVVHDSDLTRLCGVPKIVEELTLKELRELTLLGTKETIPTLHEVLDLVGDKVPLIVELKGETTDVSLARAAMPVLENSGCTYCVESFDPFLVAEYRRLAPHVMRGVLVTRFRKDGAPRGLLPWILSSLSLNFLVRPDFIAVRFVYGRKVLYRFCRLLGATAFAWTIREKSEYYSCRKYFDAFICENLDELLKKE